MPKEKILVQCKDCIFATIIIICSSIAVSINGIINDDTSENGTGYHGNKKVKSFYQAMWGSFYSFCSIV